MRTSAVQLIVNSQNKEGGWRYEPDGKEADISVTVCQIMALRAARNCGIAVPKPTVDQCVKYVLRSQKADGGFRPNLITISGNIIGSQENNVLLADCHGVVVSGNCIYSAESRNLLVEDSSLITIGSNSFRRHTPAAHAGVRLVRTKDTTIQGCSFQDEEPKGQASGASLLELEDCRRVQVTGCQVIDGAPCGIDVVRGQEISITSCTVAETREAPVATAAIRFRGEGGENLVALNTLVCPGGQPLDADDASGVRQG